MSSSPVTTTRSGTPIPAAVTYSTANQTATLNPTDRLENDTWYTVTFGNGTKDANRNALKVVRWQFLTGPAPTVRGTSPVAAATGVPPNANIGVMFSEPVEGISDTTFTVTDSTGARVAAGTIARQGTTTRWFLDPAAPLARGTTYTVRLVGGVAAITDTGGNPLTTYTWTFTTG